MATTQRAGENGTALGEALAHVTLRLRRRRWLRHGARGGLAAVVLSLLAVGAARLGLLPDWLPLELMIPLLLLAGLGAGTVTAHAHPLDPMAAARLTEARLGLKERLSSALEFERAPTAPPDPEAALLLRLQQQDAAAHARRLNARDVVPLRLPWEAAAFVAGLALLLLVLILPTLSILVPPSVRAERAVVQRSGERLNQTAQAIQKQAQAQSLPETRKAARDMQKLAQRMAQGRMDKRQAMVEMSRLRQQLADEQRRLAQAGGQPQAGGKDLPQAGRQFAQSLPAGASPSQSAGDPPPSQSAPGQSSPATPGKSGGSQDSQSGPSTPELRQAARAMQQGDAPGLGQHLRSLAQRMGGGKMAPGEQTQAAQDAQKLADALKNTPLTETQKHAQAAADALKRGDQAKAADEMRQAADAAPREAQQAADSARQAAQQRQDAQGVDDARQSLQKNEQQMAQASKPSDIPRADANPSQPGQGGSPEQGTQPGQHGPQPGQTGSQGRDPGQTGQRGAGPSQGQQPGSGAGTSRQAGQGIGPGRGPGQGRPGGTGQPGGQGSPQPGGAPQGGTPGNGGGGEGRGAAPTPGPGHYTPASGRGEQTPGHSVGVQRGAPHPLDPKFDPTKNPGYGKISLGKGDGQPGTGGKTLPGAPGRPGKAAASAVPYGSALAPARKSAETAMDREDIPASYRDSVRRYFDSLQPQGGGPAK